MPAAKDPQPNPEPQAAVPAEPQPVAWEYTAPFDSVYVHIPLTARAARAAVPGDDDHEPIPARAATVFAWPDGAPNDGRWQPTRKKPNQQPDNAPADTAPED